MLRFIKDCARTGYEMGPVKHIFLDKIRPVKNSYTVAVRTVTLFLFHIRLENIYFIINKFTLKKYLLAHQFVIIDL